MQPDISPLAKRLAEENNVDWQSLYGSGSDGRIVERDVLEYLARVMAGEEDLNPTPEPLHAGMDAWPEEDVAAGAAAQPTAQRVSSAQLTADEPGDEALLDIDTFDTKFGAPRVEIQRASSPVDKLSEVISDDIFLFDDADDSNGDDYQVVEVAFGDNEAAAGAAFFAESDAKADSDSVDSAVNPPVAAQNFSFDEDFSGGFGETSGADLQTAELNSDELNDELALLEPSSAASPLETRNVALFGDAAADESDVSLFKADGSATDEAGADTQLRQETVTALGAPDSASSLPFVSYGLLLRRRVDIGSFVQAQTAIGQELGGGGPLEPSSLLLRAAAKALAAVPLNDHENVGLAVFGDQGVQVAAIAGVLTRPLEEIAAAAVQPATQADRDATFAVIVADMSELGIDEAVLNAGAPVLTLGRMVQDGNSDTQHSTLSLSGEFALEQGANFLAVVGDLLETPIRLVF